MSASNSANVWTVEMATGWLPGAPVRQAVRRFPNPGVGSVGTNTEQSTRLAGCGRRVQFSAREKDSRPAVVSTLLSISMEPLK